MLRSLRTACCFTVVTLTLVTANAPRLLADVALPSIIGSHMVVQRDTAVPIWGWADPGETVVVSVDDQAHEATADNEGRWRVDLRPLAVGEPRTITVKGKNLITLEDVLVGEVWLCSGQSNMQWSVNATWNQDLAIKGANNSQIRIITNENPGVQVPLEDFAGQWQVASPETVPGFSAVGYFFGKQLQEVLNVPIGLIDNAWGGSSCEAWVRRDLFEDDDMYGPLMERWANDEAKAENKWVYEEFEKAWLSWQQNYIAAKKSGDALPSPPRSPNSPMVNQHRPANLYNGRIRPIMPFAIRGAIWYQGESNAGRAYQYRELFPLMIENWRTDWQQGEFPFYWVQLADFMAEKEEPGDSAWAELREAQTLTSDRLEHTGEAVIIDIGDGADIHPRNKEEVGQRLARLALTQDYGVDLVGGSPRYVEMAVEGNKATLTFRNEGGGLMAIDRREPVGFAIAGEDRKWVWAQAKINGKNQVEVWSDAVANPVAVRYAWADNPVCNVVNSVGLPMTPFRTDDWPGVTAESR